MNVEREIAGFALPFVTGIIITAYAGTIFCGQSSDIHFLALITIFCALMLLFWRRELNYCICMQWGLIAFAALGCGVLSSITALSIFDMPPSGIEILCGNIGLGMQRMIDELPFESENTSALIKALLTGERSGLSAEIKASFRASGASHILALSGLHLGIIYGILSKALSLIGNSHILRIFRSFLIICVCGIYTLATGAGDSLVRAFIFISLREVAKITGRYHGLGQILFASLVIQLVFDPLAIRSVSFQLSYSAMAGIAFIYPWLQGLWERVPEFFRVIRPIRWIWNTVALSIACQLTTTPLAYIYFGAFPMHFMLTNLLTLPLTGLLIPAALLTLVLSALGCCPILLVHTTEWLTSTLIWTLEVISLL